MADVPFPNGSVPYSPTSLPPPVGSSCSTEGGTTPISGRALDELEREVAQAMDRLSADDLSDCTGESGRDGLAPGAKLTSTVTGVGDSDVFVQFGVKTQGILPRSQFGKKEKLEVGRRVDVVVDRYDADSGLYVCSREGATQRATWSTMVPGMLVEGRVTGVIKGGLEVDLKGIRAFMPGSQVDVTPMKDISLLLNTTVRCEVIEFDRRNKNVLVSRRKVMAKERAEARDRLKAELEVGQVRKGLVGNIAEFGAFVDLGGVDGLIHISDLSWGQVGKVSDVLSPGQEVEVRVLKIDRDKDRISLGLKQAQPDPWQGVEDRYPPGSALKVRISRLADFGAFAELETGVEGLIPVSEMSWNRIRKPGDAVHVGDMVDAVVLRVETNKHRIALSMKQALGDPWAGVLESFPKDTVVRGTVVRLADFGAFVELVPGVEGLVHISELSEKRVKSCADAVKVGEAVEARVLGVDAERRKISLSIKALTAPAVTAAVVPSERTPVPVKESKKRKKPLRGGLASHFEW